LASRSLGSGFLTGSAVGFTLNHRLIQGRSLNHRGLDLHRSGSLLIVAGSNYYYSLADILLETVFDILVRDEVGMHNPINIKAYHMKAFLIRFAGNGLGGGGYGQQLRPTLDEGRVVDDWVFFALIWILE
jgi:hypothetical protein